MAIDALLPSEIARLVYGYLIEEKCVDAAKQFLNESPNLSECRRIVASGRHFSSSLNGITLMNILDKFCSVNALLQDKICEFAISDKLRHCIDLIDQVDLLLKEYKGQDLVITASKAVQTLPSTQNESPTKTWKKHSNTTKNTEKSPQKIQVPEVDCEVQDQVIPEENYKSNMVETTPLKSLPGYTKSSASKKSSVIQCNSTRKLDVALNSYKSLQNKPVNLQKLAKQMQNALHHDVEMELRCEEYLSRSSYSEVQTFEPEKTNNSVDNDVMTETITNDETLKKCSSSEGEMPKNGSNKQQNLAEEKTLAQSVIIEDQPILEPQIDSVPETVVTQNVSKKLQALQESLTFAPIAKFNKESKQLLPSSSTVCVETSMSDVHNNPNVLSYINNLIQTADNVESKENNVKKTTQRKKAPPKEKKPRAKRKTKELEKVEEQSKTNLNVNDTNNVEVNNFTSAEIPPDYIQTSSINGQLFILEEKSTSTANNQLTGNLQLYTNVSEPTTIQIPANSNFGSASSTPIKTYTTFQNFDSCNWFCSSPQVLTSPNIIFSKPDDNLALRPAYSYNYAICDAVVPTFCSPAIPTDTMKAPEKMTVDISSTSNAKDQTLNTPDIVCTRESKVTASTSTTVVTTAPKTPTPKKLLTSVLQKESEVERACISSISPYLKGNSELNTYFSLDSIVMDSNSTNLQGPLIAMENENSLSISGTGLSPFIKLNEKSESADTETLKQNEVASKSELDETPKDPTIVNQKENKNASDNGVNEVIKEPGNSSLNKIDSGFSSTVGKESNSDSSNLINKEDAHLVNPANPETSNKLLNEETNTNVCEVINEEVIEHMTNSISKDADFTSLPMEEVETDSLIPQSKIDSVSQVQQVPSNSLELTEANEPIVIASSNNEATKVNTVESNKSTVASKIIGENVGATTNGDNSTAVIDNKLKEVVTSFSNEAVSKLTPKTLLDNREKKKSLSTPKKPNNHVRVLDFDAAKYPRTQSERKGNSETACLSPESLKKSNKSSYKLSLFQSPPVTNEDIIDQNVTCNTTQSFAPGSAAVNAPVNNVSKLQPNNQTVESSCEKAENKIIETNNVEPTEIQDKTTKKRNWDTELRKLVGETETVVAEDKRGKKTKRNEKSEDEPNAKKPRKEYKKRSSSRSKKDKSVSENEQRTDDDKTVDESTVDSKKVTDKKSHKEKKKDKKTPKKSSKDRKDGKTPKKDKKKEKTPRKSKKSDKTPKKDRKKRGKSKTPKKSEKKVKTEESKVAILNEIDELKAKEDLERILSSSINDDIMKLAAEELNNDMRQTEDALEVQDDLTLIMAHNKVKTRGKELVDLNLSISTTTSENDKEEVEATSGSNAHQDSTTDYDAIEAQLCALTSDVPSKSIATPPIYDEVSKIESGKVVQKKYARIQTLERNLDKSIFEDKRNSPLHSFTIDLESTSKDSLQVPPTPQIGSPSSCSWIPAVTKASTELHTLMSNTSTMPLECPPTPDIVRTPPKSEEEVAVKASEKCAKCQPGEKKTEITQFEVIKENLLKDKKASETEARHATVSKATELETIVEEQQSIVKNDNSKMSVLSTQSSFSSESSSSSTSTSSLSGNENEAVQGGTAIEDQKSQESAADTATREEEKVVEESEQPVASKEKEISPTKIFKIHKSDKEMADSLKETPAKDENAEVEIFDTPAVVKGIDLPRTLSQMMILTEREESAKNQDKPKPKIISVETLKSKVVTKPTAPFIKALPPNLQLQALEIQNELCKTAPPKKVIIEKTEEEVATAVESIMNVSDDFENKQASDSSVLLPSPIDEPDERNDSNKSELMKAVASIKDQGLADDIESPMYSPIKRAREDSGSEANLELVLEDEERPSDEAHAEKEAEKADVVQKEESSKEKSSDAVAAADNNDKDDGDGTNDSDSDSSSGSDSGSGGSSTSDTDDDEKNKSKTKQLNEKTEEKEEMKDEVEEEVVKEEGADDEGDEQNKIATFEDDNVAKNRINTKYEHVVFDETNHKKHRRKAFNREQLKKAYRLSEHEVVATEVTEIDMIFELKPERKKPVRKQVPRLTLVVNEDKDSEESDDEVPVPEPPPPTPPSPPKPKIAVPKEVSTTKKRKRVFVSTQSTPKIRKRKNILIW